MEFERNTIKMALAILSETVGGKAMEFERNTIKMALTIMSETVGTRS